MILATPSRILIFKIFISALLLVLAFPNPLFLYGCPAAVWCFAVALLDALQGLDVRRRIAVSIAFGMAAYGLLVSWLWPLNAAGAFLFVLALSVQTLLFGAAFWTMKPSWLKAVYGPSLWCASEWLRTVGSGGFCWSIAYSQSFHPAMIQSAAFAGPYGTAFAIMSVNYALWQAWRNPRRRLVCLTAAGLMVASVYGWGHWVLSHKTVAPPDVRIGAVQGNIDPRRKASLEDFDAMIEEQIQLSRQLPKGLDLVVWPETAFPADLFRDAVWFPRLRQLSQAMNAPFLVGIVPFEHGQNFNSAALFKTSAPGGVDGIYHKRFLVPLSERAFAAGTKPGLFEIAKTRLGVMICSETAYPSLARDLKRRGARLQIVMLNDGWFVHQPAILMHGHNAIWRAVETGSSIVSVGNTGLTASIDALGRITPGLSLQTAGVCILPASSQTITTFYSQYGDFFAALCLLFVIITSAYHFRKMSAGSLPTEN